MPVSTGLGSALKRWRGAAGLHQTVVAMQLGVSQSTISASEGGTFSAGLLLRLIDLYKPDVDDLAREMQAGSDGASAAVG